MKKQVENEIQKLLVRYFINLVTSSSKWVSPSVCVPKKYGDVRLFVDMRKVNIAIIRNYYPIPTLDEILYLVIGATIFSKLDLAQGYHQIVLDEKNQEILELLVLLKGCFNINVYFLLPKMRLKVYRKLL